MLTAPPRLAIRLVAPRLWRCLDAIGAIGAPAAGAAAGAAALGGDLAAGVIGACAHAGAAIARAAAIATPFKRCFMPLSSVAVLDWRIRCNGLLYPRATLAGLGAKTTVLLFRSREHATFSVTYPTSPVADNMTGDARFQALGAISVQLANVFRASRSLSRRCRRQRLAALALALVLSAPAIAEERDSLTLGIHQFPS